jgi:hypothetical protein
MNNVPWLYCKTEIDLEIAKWASSSIILVTLYMVIV